MGVTLLCINMEDKSSTRAGGGEGNRGRDIFTQDLNPSLGLYAKIENQK